MRRLRITLVTALAAASLGIAAPPASACPPDDQVPCQCDEANEYWERLTGQRLLNCW